MLRCSNVGQYERRISYAAYGYVVIIKFWKIVLDFFFKFEFFRLFLIQLKLEKQFQIDFFICFRTITNSSENYGVGVNEVQVGRTKY